MNSSPLQTLARRHNGLRILSDDTQTRITYPIASDQVIFRHTSTPSPRPVGELMEVVEGAVGGKFVLPVAITSEKSLEPASGRTADQSKAPLATLEIWSLEPGSFDLVLKLPAKAIDNEATAALVTRFVDQAREITRIIDNTDLLRFQSGPALTLTQAQRELSHLERTSGTRLDAENLLTLLKQKDRALLN